MQWRLEGLEDGCEGSDVCGRQLPVQEQAPLIIAPRGDAAVKGQHRNLYVRLRQLHGQVCESRALQGALQLHRKVLKDEITARFRKA